MVDILKMGSNSLLSMQKALSTTGHNIANVNTEGFSRQTVRFETSKSQSFGFGFIGQGSQIQSVERSYNSFLTSQVQSFTSSKSRYEVFVNFSSRIDNILANSENSLNSSIQRFFNANSDVVASPSSLPERQVLIAEANNLVDRQNSFNKLLQDLNAEVNASLGLTLNEINTLSDSIATLNNEIVSASSASNGAPPNDLLDKRDVLIRRLSEKVAVSTIRQDDGALNVFLDKGQSLVVGTESVHLHTQANPYDSSRMEVAIVGQLNINGISSAISGGELEGLLDFRNRVLVPAQTQLGLITLGLSETVNTQHRLGQDLNGDLGENFFKAPDINIAGHSSNLGTSVPVVALNDVGNLRASDYLLAFDGAQWQLSRLSDNTSISGAGPLSLDGMTIDVSSGVPSAGDSFILNPARTAASVFALEISDPRKIAAADAVMSEVSIANSGTGNVSDLIVANNNTLPLSGPVTLSFNPDAFGLGVPGFDVTGGVSATLAYDPLSESGGKQFNFASVGLTFNISERPQSGDTFVINNNLGAQGDNRNAQKISNLQYQALLNGGKDSYQEFYGSLVAQVGATSRQASDNLDIEGSLLQQAEEYWDSVSGVDLDEEAANLLRYQHSYQAAAQLIKIADELFQSLLNSMR